MTSKRILESRARDAAKTQAKIDRAEHISRTALFNVVDLDEKRRESRRMVTAGAFSFRYLPDRQPGTKARYIFLAERGSEVPKPKRLSDLRSPKRETLAPWVKVVDKIVKFYQIKAETQKDGIITVSLFSEGKSLRQAEINSRVRALLDSGRFVFRYVDPADWGPL